MSHQSEAIVPKNIESLLKRVNTIVNHQNEVSRLKGENFNIFSILKMERKENETHSAFIHELLNPKGSHLMGDVFLALFITEIEGLKKFKELDFDLASAKTKVEHHISKRDDEAKTGGRIDILIRDRNGKTISIENKIDAGDQDFQIERYVNFNKKNNVVFYLTKFGDQATEGSKGELKEERDYCCISYKETIVEWLEKCIKEAAEMPILRESLKQYIILVKKITNQLNDDKMATEIEDLIVKNYEAAKLIQSNVQTAELNGVINFTKLLESEIKKSLSEKEWDIDIDDDPTSTYSGVWIRSLDWHDDIFVQFQGESRIAYHSSICGIHAPSTQFSRKNIDTLLSNIKMYGEKRQQSVHFPCYEYVLDLSNDETRKRVLFDQKERDIKVKEIAEIMVATAKETELLLKGVKLKRK